MEMINYKQHRIGIFRIDTNVYDVNVGWIHREEERVIIGETLYSYTYEYLTTSCGYWDDLGRYTAYYTMALGIHKSRFVKWKETQMTLFNEEAIKTIQPRVVDSLQGLPCVV